jgi:catechol 2,3-dioxygenase-like lactoylglutathione lyase family enzyme
MSTTDAGLDVAAQPQDLGTIDMKIEVVTVPVADVDRAKAFYQGLGWRVDADISPGGAFRVVQMTPLHSEASFSMGKGLNTVFGVPEMEPGSQHRLELVVADIEAARDDLISRGADVGELFHLGPSGPTPGPDPDRASYGTYATFADPDGNTWLLQEVNERRPGRTWDD